MKFNDNYLVISDLQIPFELKDSLKFCIEVIRDFKIPKTNILCVGDEVDHYFGSLYTKDVNAKMSALDEIEMTIDKLRSWYAVFPTMKLATSNHGMRWLKKANLAEIPEVMMKQYQEVLRAPKGWRWRDEWIINTKRPFRMIHGLGYSGPNGHRQCSMEGAINSVMGHVHSHAGVSYIQTARQLVWGMNVGCLMDPNSVASQYAKNNRSKSVVGVGVVLDSGRIPIFIPKG